MTEGDRQKQTEMDRGRKTDRQGEGDRQTEGDTDREGDRQRDRQRHTGWGERESGEGRRLVRLACMSSGILLN